MFCLVLTMLLIVNLQYGNYFRVWRRRTRFARNLILTESVSDMKKARLIQTIALSMLLINFKIFFTLATLCAPYALFVLVELNIRNDLDAMYFSIESSMFFLLLMIFFFSVLKSYKWLVTTH